jgi:Ca2+-binding RTX toxin-like protein
VVGALVVVVWLAWGSGSALAASSTCTYNTATRTVAVDLESYGVLVRAGNAIDFNGSPCGTATVMNTDQIIVRASGSADEIVIDLSAGPFSNPNLPGDIPIAVNMSALPENGVEIVGSANPDSIRLGTAGINLNADSGPGVDVTLANVERFMVLAGDGDDVVSAAGGDGTGAALPPSNSSVFIGGPGNDTLTGGAGGDDLDGGPGDDTLDGGAGQDTAAFYWDDPEPVTADLATGTATDGTGGRDTLTGFENLLGGVGATLIGDDNANVLTGVDGGKALIGGGGNDILVNAGGAIDGGTGTDTYRCVVDSDTGVTVDLATGSTDGCGGATLSGIENVIAATTCDEDMGCPVVIIGDGGDNVLAAASSGCNCLATISGGGGADTLVGTTFRNGPQPGDTLNGGPGNDVIFGLWGDDTLVGGAGADTIFGGFGADHIWGLDGRDTLVGGSGADRIRGGRGADDLFGRRGPDSLYGGFGNDHLTGGRGIDICRGGPGTNTLSGCE